MPIGAAVIAVKEVAKKAVKETAKQVAKETKKDALKDKLKQAKNFRHIEEESNKLHAARLLQCVGRQTLVVNPPFPPMT